MNEFVRLVPEAENLSCTEPGARLYYNQTVVMRAVVTFQVFPYSTGPCESAADEKGYIVADESCTTTCEGLYVAGDIRKKPLRQIITAAADGANAVTSAIRYLQEKESR